MSVVTESLVTTARASTALVQRQPSSRCTRACHRGRHFRCAACHRDFGGLEAFDMHQRGYGDPDDPVVCLHPVEVGLVHGNRGRWACVVIGEFSASQGAGVPSTMPTTSNRPGVRYHDRVEEPDG